MVIAIDIFSDSVKKTKELFFPIRKGYWVRMAFLSAFTGRASGSLGNGLGSGNGDSGIGFKESIASFNAEALSFFAKYGTILGVFLGMLVAIGTAISFISSVLTFSFIEGIDKQEIRLRKSWKTHQGDGLSLFFVRWVFGLLSLLVFLAIFYPVIAAFLSNTLSAFNWWLLIPMVLGLILISFPIGIALFILECFVVPIMYYKKKG
ncbi:MAG: hypothetical protein HGA85_02110, partial [Nanoarchaeota archaeon]|nr:hypothetical protein [Nanoarchaeota archaeon]